MKKSTTASLLLILCFAISSLIVLVNAEPSWVEWSQTYGGTDDDALVYLVETFDGGYVLAGNTYSFGAGDSDFWLVKTDELGNVEWNRTYGGENSDIATSLVQTSDGGYALAGNTRSFGAGDYDYWLVKTDGSGNMEWSRTYGGESDDKAYSVVQTSDGGYALGGKALFVGTRFYDFWLVKTDELGNVEWNRTYGGTGRQIAYSLVETSDGGYALVGDTNSFESLDFWLVKTDNAGNMQWNRTYGGAKSDAAGSLIETSDGGYALAGYTIPSDARYSDFWLVKTDVYGNVIWNHTYGGSAEESANSLIETSDRGFALVGDTRSYVGAFNDVWLVKTDVFGNMEWNRTYGGENGDNGNSLVQTSDGGYILAGETNSFDIGEGDFWLVKTNEQGIPEFPPWIILPLIVAVMLMAVAYRKRLAKYYQKLCV